MKLKCVAIDDEPIALKILEEFCKRKDDIEISTFVDPDLGLANISSNKPDVVFLDIELNGESGLNLAKKLPDGTALVFTTAFLEYALEGYNFDAVDYLHKPFSFQRFCEAVEKAKRRLVYHEFMVRDRQITVKQSYNNVPVNICDILYVESMENYSKIHLKNNKMVLAHNLLKNIAEMLPKHEFVRIHKSYVIPLAEIKSFNQKSVTLSSGAILPVGRRFASNLKR